MQKFDCSKCWHHWFSDSVPKQCPKCHKRNWQSDEKHSLQNTQLIKKDLDSDEKQPVENIDLPMVAGESESKEDVLRGINSKPSPPKSKTSKCWLELPRKICAGGVSCWHKEMRLAHGLKEKK